MTQLTPTDPSAPAQAEDDSQIDAQIEHSIDCLKAAILSWQRDDALYNAVTNASQAGTRSPIIKMSVPADGIAGASGQNLVEIQIDLDTATRGVVEPILGALTEHGAKGYENHLRDMAVAAASAMTLMGFDTERIKEVLVRGAQ